MTTSMSIMCFFNLFCLVLVFQEIEFLTCSIGQFKVAQTKYVEAKDSLNVLNQNNKGA